MKAATFDTSFCWNAPYIPMIASVTRRSSSAGDVAARLGPSPPSAQHDASAVIRIAGRIIRMSFPRCRAGPSSWFLVPVLVLNDREEIAALEFGQPFEEGQLDQARAARHHAADLLDQ